MKNYNTMRLMIEAMGETMGNAAANGLITIEVLEKMAVDFKNQVERLATKEQYDEYNREGNAALRDAYNEMQGLEKLEKVH